MPAWSSLGGNALRFFSGKINVIKPSLVRNMSGGHDRKMQILPSKWQWLKFKDLLHLYTMIGLVPVGLIVFYSNVFIGPAKLAEIPEGYTPKHWEYYRHPITRFFARYFFNPPQQEYEKYLHQLYEEDEKQKMRKLEQQVLDKMKENTDYQAYYFVPIDGKYHRLVRKYANDLRDVAGLSERKV